ncbi:Beta-chimaerin [Smittium culicis]|uniref:Beta-chimaerin n=2 Tax=Smittium culicis TaxID=133412 RepID=A0A1R1YFD4_9FUNG|nr:Beta-chimaerin [Smittium culicis]
MSWSGGWRNTVHMTEYDNKDQNKNKGKHLSIFGSNLKKSILSKRDDFNKTSQSSDSKSFKSSWAFRSNSNNSERSSTYYGKISFNSSDSSPSINSATANDLSIPSDKRASISNKDHSSRSVIIKSGYLSKKSDNMSVTSLGSALGKSWRVYRVVLKGAKLFFYKPPPESELRALFNVDNNSDYPSSTNPTSSGMPVTPADVESASRSILFDPVVSDGVIQKPLCDRYIFGDCFTEVELKNLKFKRYVSVLIFDDKIVILKRRWVKESRTSNFFLNLGSKMRLNKKNYPPAADNSSLVSVELGIKGKGSFTKWKSHAVYDIKNVEAIGTISTNSKSSQSQSNLNSIVSSRTSMYSVGNQSLSSVMTKNSIVSKDYSGMISTGVAPGFQIFVSGNQSTTRIFIATSVDAKNNWMARFSVAKASYSRKFRQTIFENTQKSNRWNSSSTIKANEIRSRTTSRNFDHTFISNIQSQSNLYPQITPKETPVSANYDPPSTSNTSPQVDPNISQLEINRGPVITNLDPKEKESFHLHSTFHPELIIINGIVAGGTLNALVHEAIFANATTSNSFRSSIAATVDRFTTIDLFISTFEKNSNLVDPSSPSHFNYIINIAEIISQFSKFYAGKCSTTQVESIEKIANSKVYATNSPSIDLNSLKNSIETLKYQQPPFQAHDLNFIFYDKLVSQPNINPSQIIYLVTGNPNNNTDLSSKSTNNDLNLINELSSINVNGLSSSTLLKISPEDFSVQTYLFHSSMTVNLDEQKIKYFIYNSIKGFREKFFTPSLLTIGSATVAEKNSSITSSKININSNSNTNKPVVDESSSATASLKYFSADVLFRVLFFTPSDPHFFSRLIHHHLLVETPQNFPSRRASILLHWIKIGEASRLLGDSIMFAAVAIAVTSPPIARLRETWSTVPLNWKVTISSIWVPILIKHGLCPIKIDSSSNNELRYLPLILDVDENSNYTPIPYYGVIRNAIEVSGKFSPLNFDESVIHKIKSMDGIFFDKFANMFETFQSSTALIESKNKDLLFMFNSLNTILSNSIVYSSRSEQNLKKHPSPSFSFDNSNNSLSYTLSLDNNNDLSPSLNFEVLEFIPEAQFYFKSLSESPLLFVNDNIDEDEVLYDFKYLMTLSIQCERSVTEHYQEMLHLDLIDENAEKNGLSTQVASVRTEDGLRLASSAILPLVCPELVSSTNVLQWISPLKRGSTSTWNSKTNNRRTKTNAPSTLENSNSSHKDSNSNFFLSLKIDKSTNLNDLEIKSSVTSIFPDAKLHTTSLDNPPTNDSNGLKSKSPSISFSDSNDSPIHPFTKSSTICAAPEGFADSSLEKANSRKRSSSIPKKLNNYLELSEFPKMSQKDSESGFPTLYSPIIESPKNLNAFVGHILYSNNWNISFRVIRVQYSHSDLRVYRDSLPDSRRSSMSSKINSQSFLDSTYSLNNDQLSKPIGFFVQVESASVLNLFRILIEGLDFIGFVYETNVSSDHILINGDTIPRLFIDRSSFLRSFMATYRQFCVDLDLTTYINNILTSDDGVQLAKPQICYNLLELIFIWTTQYPEDFLENISLVTIIYNLLSNVKSKLDSIKSSLPNPVIDQNNLDTYANESYISEIAYDTTIQPSSNDAPIYPIKSSDNLEDSFFNETYRQSSTSQADMSLQIVDDLLSKIDLLKNVLPECSISPLSFPIPDKLLADFIKSGESVDAIFQQKKIQQKNLLSYPSPSAYEQIPRRLSDAKYFTLDNLTPMEVLSSLNRLVQTHFARCMPRDWQMSFCLLEVQTRFPLSWYSTKKQSSHSDEDTVISDIFQVLSNAGRPSGHLDSLEKRDTSTSSKYLGNINISLLTSFGNKGNNTNGARNESSLVSMLPSSIQTLINIHNVIKSWAIQMITDTSITYTERSHRICFFLYIIHLCRSNNDQSASHAFEEALESQSGHSQPYTYSSFSDFVSRSNSLNKPQPQANGNTPRSASKASRLSRRFTGSNTKINIDRRLSNRNPAKNRANRYVPSFVERAIASALVSPESRMFVRTWNHIAVLHHITLSTLELMLKGVRDWSFDRWFHTQTALVSGESMTNAVDNGPSNGVGNSGASSPAASPSSGVVGGGFGVVGNGTNGELTTKNQSQTEDFLVPCVGWLLENFISLCYDSPDIIEGENQLVNFSKRQNIHSMLSACNILSSRCIDMISLPVVSRIYIEKLINQVISNQIKTKNLKYVSNEENNIPLYANISKPDPNQLFNEYVPNFSNNNSNNNGSQNSMSFGSNFSSPNQTKSRMLGGRAPKNKSGINNAFSPNSSPMNFGTNNRPSRAALSPPSSYINSPQYSGRSTISSSDTSQSFYYSNSSNNTFGSKTSKYGHNSSTINNQQNSNNRFLNNHFQFPSSPKSAVINLTIPFSKLIQDEQEKQRHESLERLKLEREYREKRHALERFTNERTKALKKSLKEQVQRNAKNHQLLKMNTLMNRVESNINSEYSNTSQPSEISPLANGEFSNGSELPSSLGLDGTDEDMRLSLVSESGLKLDTDSVNAVDERLKSNNSLPKGSIRPRGPSLPVTKPANVVNLINSTITIEQSYTKRDFVFRVVTEEGGQVLLQAPSESEMNEWISAMREAATEAAARRLTLFVQDSQKKNNSANHLPPEGPPSIQLKQFSNYNLGFGQPVLPSDTDSAVSLLNTDSPNTSVRFFDHAFNHDQESLKESTLNSFDQLSISPSQSCANSNSSNQKSISSVTHQTKKSFKSFGISLDLLMANPKSAPLVLTKCITEIERRGLNEIGIYRVSGSTLEVSRLKTLLNSNPEQTDISEEAFPDINVISGVLKHFLRELPEPLIPFNLFSGFINAADISDYDERLWAIKDLINTLPERNFTVLKHLVEHLEKVTDYEEINHMYASNLALVFGPSLIHPPPGDSNFYSAMSTLGQAQSIVKNMILQYHWLFDIEEEVGSVVGGDFNVGDEALSVESSKLETTKISHAVSH